MSSKFVNESLENIPLEHLIGTPLMAAGKAQKQLADTSVAFIKSFLNSDQDWSTSSPGSETVSDALAVKFSYNRKGTREPTQSELDASPPTYSAGDVIATNTEIVYEIPLLAIVWVPSLFVDRVLITFETEITSIKKSTSELKFSAKSGGWFSPVDIKMTGKFSGSRSNSIKSTYFVEVEATDRGYNTGLEKVMNAITEGVGASKEGTDATTTDTSS